MSDEQDIIAANKAFYRAFEKKDIEAMSAIWSKGTASVCIHPGRDVIQGWEAVRASWEQIFQVTNYLEINMKIMSTEISGDLAYVVLIEDVMQVLGRRRMRAESLATNIFSRMANQWYIIHHHASPIMK